MTNNGKIDVFGVGNALVDTLAFVDEDFIREHNLNRGLMTLVEADEQGRLLAALEGKGVELHSGGSAANTMFGIALSGGTGFYTSKVAQDPNGEFYREDMLKAGIHFDVHPVEEGQGNTGTCVVMTTPDAQRTMYTHLGVSTGLVPDDIDTEKLVGCQYLYLEGYLLFGDEPRAACIKAADAAKKSGVKVTLTYSDPSVIEALREHFVDLTREYCDIIFCNADEARAFAETQDLDVAIKKIGEMVEMAFITNSEKGAYVVEKTNVRLVEGFPCKPLDTTGAGDAFAAGVLFGLAHNYGPDKAARWGNYLAAETVKIAGARLSESQKHKVKEIIG